MAEELRNYPNPKQLGCCVKNPKEKQNGTISKQIVFTVNGVSHSGKLPPIPDCERWSL